MKPAVSVVIPLHNKGAYIEAAVHSVLTQDYPDFEVLIVDDKSTDDGVARVQAFVDSRMRILRQSHAGVGAARNRALREARGDIFAFLDADDEWLPTHVSDLVFLARKFPTAGILATRVALRIAGNLVLDNTVGSKCACLVDNYFALAAQHKGSFVNSSSCAVRREVVARVGDFVEAAPHGEDQEYWARISLSYPTAFHPRVSSIYRIGIPGCATSLARWEPVLPPVMRTLRYYLAAHPTAPNVPDVLNYAAWILLNHAANGIKSNPREVRQLLADPLLSRCRFQRRVRALSLASAMPQHLARVAFFVHNSTWAAAWRGLYAKITG